MKNRSWIPINSVLALLVCFAALLIVRVGSDTSQTLAKASGRAAEGSDIAGPRSSSNDRNSSSIDPGSARFDPASVASAMGWYSPPAPPMPASPVAAQPAAKLQEASWIRYVGTITESDGVAYRYFKDDRTGRVIRAAEGRSLDGWNLTPRGNGSFLLTDGTDSLLVRIP